MISRIKSLLIDKYFIKRPWIRRVVTKIIYGSADHRIRLMGADLVVNATRENGYLRAFQKADNSSLFRDEISGLLGLFYLLKPGDCFVDIGANIGLYSSIISRISSIRVLALEANPDTFNRLEKNSRLHRFEAINTAISDCEGELDFADGAVSHVFAVAQHRTVYNTSEIVRVRSTKLDTVLATRSGPFICKIDVEDHEPQVLCGATKVVSCGLIQAVMLDVSEKSLEAARGLQKAGFILIDANTLTTPSDSTSVYFAVHPERYHSVFEKP